MNSLKAIFTGQRRTKVFLILLSLLLLPLGAKDWKAGIINDGAGPEFLSSFTSALEMGGSVLSDEAKIESAEEALLREKALRAERDAASAARSEKTYTPKEEKEDDSAWKVVPVQIKDVPEEDLAFLLSGDEHALWHYMRTNGLNELWILEGRMRDGLEEVAVIRDGIEEMLFLTSHEFRARDEKRMLEFFLSEYRAREAHLLLGQGNVSAEILVDGEPAEMIGPYVLLEGTKARIRVERPLYESAEYDVDTEKDDRLVYELKPREGESVFVSSIPYTDDITYNGRTAVGGFIPSPSLPFTVSVKKDGYESLVVSSPESIGLLEPVLFPSELRDEGKLLDARDRFYTDLILTLSGFGLGVVSTVVDSVVENTDLTGLSTFCYGLSVFQLIRTMDSLFAYKDAMRFGL